MDEYDEFVSKQQVYMINGIFHDSLLRQILDQLVARLPAADVKPVVHGRWIIYPSPDEYHCDKYICDHCGYEMDAEKSNFCPNCGAEMRCGR